MGSMQEPVLTPEELIALRDQKVAGKFDEVGLWDSEQDSLDRSQLHVRMYSVIRKAEVRTKTERTTNAVTRGTLVRFIMSDIPVIGSDEYKELDEIDQAVAREVTNRIWREVKPYQETGLAASVRAEGKILIKTEVAVEDEAVPACYVTNNPDLIRQDYRGPLRDKVRKESERYAINMARVAKVLPENAESFRKEVAKDMKAAENLTKSILALEAGGDAGE
jgi:hypothetical protein